MRSTVILTSLSIATIAFAVGCATQRTAGQFDQGFLPAVPYVAPPTVNVPPEPPKIAAPPRFQDTPKVVTAKAKASVDKVFLDTAEQHFREGERLYEAGNTAGARREFDLAVNTVLTSPVNLAQDPQFERKVEKLIEEIHDYDMAGLGAADEGEVFELDETPEMTFPVDPKMKDRVVEQVRAAVSQLPLEVNDSVLSYIRFYSSPRGTKIMQHGLVRAGRYRSMIERIFDEEGVPRELIHLAQAESGFQPRAVSRAKASGMWQFVKYRGQEYGLDQSVAEDARLDPEKATRAAARHLRDLYNEFGDWYLAMAAYNCGPYAVERSVERTGYADFWELQSRRALPRETINYVPSIVAMAIMTKYPKEYGLEDVQPEPAVAYDKIEITAPTNLRLIADLVGCPDSEVQELNPSLLKGYAPAGHMLRVPAGKGSDVLAVLAMIPEDKRATWRAHRVEEGETLAAIAIAYRSQASRIAEVNEVNGDNLETGDFLMIPVAAQPARPAATKRTRQAQPSSSRRKAHLKTASVTTKRRSTRTD